MSMRTHVYVYLYSVMPEARILQRVYILRSITRCMCVCVCTLYKRRAAYSKPMQRVARENFEKHFFLFLLNKFVEYFRIGEGLDRFEVSEIFMIFITQVLTRFSLIYMNKNEAFILT